METAELVCDQRGVRSKGQARALRRAGEVPGILYGPARPAIALKVASDELAAHLGAISHQRLIRLRSQAPELEGKYIIVKDVQHAPVSGAILHVDFYEVDLSKPVGVSVPLRFSGRAVGVGLGGILQPLEREIKVECLPLEIPEFIEVDVSGLGIHDVIHVSELQFTSGVRPVFEADYPVVTVLPPTVEAAPAAAPAEVAAAPEAGAAEAPAAEAEGESKGKEAAAPGGPKK